MKKSAQPMNTKVETSYKSCKLGDAKTVMGDYFKALMTENELSAVAKRLAIAVFLDKRQSYEHIRDILKVSTATIASVAEGMNKRGIQMALAKVKAEEWADVWSIRLSRALEKLMK